MNSIILTHAAATLLITGVNWFVQVVHYPLFAAVSGDFSDYSRRHGHLTTFVVAPLMLTEAATAAFLAVWDPGWLTGTGILLLAMVWASTALVQVPCHRRLSTGFDAATQRRLVRTNWVRTTLWSGRSAVALALVAERLG